MKDKRTYKNRKEHGEDMSHENESKIKPREDRGPLDLTLLTDQYKADLKKYQDRESIYIQTKNQLDGTNAIVMEMAGTIREVHTQNENLRKEIDRLNEEIQLLEMQIKK